MCDIALNTHFIRVNDDDDDDGVVARGERSTIPKSIITLSLLVPQILKPFTSHASWRISTGTRCLSVSHLQSSVCVCGACAARRCFFFNVLLCWDWINIHIVSIVVIIWAAVTLYFECRIAMSSPTHRLSSVNTIYARMPWHVGCYNANDFANILCSCNN